MMSQDQGDQQEPVDRSAEFEQRLTDGPTREQYVLRLYVTGMSPRSTRAIETIKSICEMELEGRYELEVIDLAKQPELARQEDIIAAPTLIKELPWPLRRLIGNLSDTQRVLKALELEPKSSTDGE